MPRYLILSILGCFLYAAFASSLLAKMVPPPYVPGLSEGRGLDLRGVGLVVGSWIGDLAGVACALLTVAVSPTVRWRRTVCACVSAPPTVRRALAVFPLDM